MDKSKVACFFGPPRILSNLFVGRRDIVKTGDGV